ncbi:hypothetical protein J437_LFUL004485 [Ladona fulva]|uniref:Uncharacterized protein n=1 Tax=Ladona fulva TaxID=123851 RepID=A0A8K0P2F7_LADFU|nr:hypothetical protein J437_LFUL004485 [Ladona fulva]
MPKVKDSKFLFKRKGVLHSPDSVKVIQDELIETIELEEDQTSKNTSLPYVDKDQESDEFNTADLGNETSRIMETFASDMNKAFSAKKRDIEMFTDNVIKISQSYTNRILNSHKKNGDLLEDFCPKFIGVVDQIGEDLVRQKERVGLQLVSKFGS